MSEYFIIHDQKLSGYFILYISLFPSITLFFSSHTLVLFHLILYHFFSSVAITWDGTDTRICVPEVVLCQELFHFFGREYNHEVYLTVDGVDWGKIIYQTWNWKVHCHRVYDWLSFMETIVQKCPSGSTVTTIIIQPNNRMPFRYTFTWCLLPIWYLYRIPEVSEAQSMEGGTGVCVLEW